MSTVDPWDHARRPHPPTVAARTVGAFVTGVAGLTLATLVVGIPGASATSLPVQDVRTGAVRSLAAAPGALQAPTQRWGDDTTRQARRAGTVGGTWRPQHDLGSSLSVAQQVGADEVWAGGDDRGASTGAGVGVAVIDTGVSTVEGLAVEGKVRRGPDLSSDAGAVRGDGMGHGTHMAGLIAGRDADVRPGHEADGEGFVGIAPDAHLVDVRVGAADGAVHVAQVVEALDWVAAHHEQAGIDVVNLSYGTTDGPSWALARAVERVWDEGVVVVAAAGNDGGSGALPMTMPAAHPDVIAVGSSDHRGSVAPGRARVGAWTNPGTVQRRPDVLAPGKSVVSLRVPGSQADREHPEGLVAGDREGRFFRGTGTSQSAAVVSGVVALLLQADPSLTPDQVKGLLRGTAQPLAGDRSPVQGAGVVDAAAAVDRVRAGGVPGWTQTAPRLARTAERDGTDAALEAAWTGRSWSGRSWSGRSWSGRSWSGRSWSADDWSGRSWSGRSWSADDWSGRSWSGRSWSGRSWSGDDWNGRSWSGRSWSADDWNGRSWSGRSWS